MHIFGKIFCKRNTFEEKHKDKNATIKQNSTTKAWSCMCFIDSAGNPEYILKCCFGGSWEFTFFPTVPHKRCPKEIQIIE